MWVENTRQKNSPGYGGYFPLYFKGLLGAGNQVRTGDLNLGKVALYQLSYSREETGLDEWRPLGGSNPCYRRERAVSWTTRRRGRSTGNGSRRQRVIVPKQGFNATRRMCST